MTSTGRVTAAARPTSTTPCWPAPSAPPPPPAVMRKLGDKIASKLLAGEAGLRGARWGGGPLLSVEEARRHGDGIGYPVVIKATAGGGGRGIRVVSSAADLPAAYESAAAE